MNFMIECSRICGLVVGASMLIAAGCSADSGGADTGNSNNGSTTGSGGAAGGGNAPGAGAGGVLPTGQGGGFGAIPNMGGMGGDEVCGMDRYRGEAQPLDVFIMFDRSSSMVGIAGANVWGPVTQAVINFLNLPTAGGIGVGIGFFPPYEVATDPTAECNVGLYAIPEAPIADLPGNAQAIQGAIAANYPFDGLNPLGILGFTPTLPAMQGARDFARQWQTDHPEKKVVVVLVTDGEPNNCNSNIPAVAGVAAELFTGAPPIPTYVIGIGNVANLDQVAAAGGTNTALIVPADPAVAADQFRIAMDTIRGLAIPCDYALTTDANADPTKVNLDVTANGVTTRLGYTGSEANCDPVNGGWYFDDANAPTRAITCRATCTQLTNTMGVQMDIVVGCPREDIY